MDYNGTKLRQDNLSLTESVFPLFREILAQTFWNTRVRRPISSLAAVRSSSVVQNLRRLGELAFSIAKLNVHRVTTIES